MKTKPTQSELNCQLLNAVTDLRERMDKAESHIRSLEATNDHLMDWLTDLDKKVCRTPLDVEAK